MKWSLGALLLGAGLLLNSGQTLAANRVALSRTNSPLHLACSTHRTAGFCIQSLRVERKGQKADWNFRLAPLRTVRVGTPVRISLYYVFRRLSSTASVRTRVKVYFNNALIRTLKKGCFRNCARNYLGQNRDYWSFKPTRVGTYKLVGTVRTPKKKESITTRLRVKG